MKCPVTNIVWIIAFIAGCGGATRGSSGADTAADREASALREFRDVISPALQAKAGTERVTKTCEAADAMLEKAKATQDSSLVARVSSLAAECNDPQRDEVEAWLAKVDERFRELSH